MTIILLFFSAFFIQEAVPYLTEDEYSYEMEFFLKRKTKSNTEAYNVNEKRPRTNTDVLPYVKMHFTILKIEDSDKRVQIYHGNHLVSSKKIKGPLLVTLDMGYAVDLKEGTAAADYTIYILDEDKNKRARITVEVKENGELFVNEVLSGMI